MKTLLSISFLFLSCFLLDAQPGDNPFEMVPRLPKKELTPSQKNELPDNPFDLASKRSDEAAGPDTQTGFRTAQLPAENLRFLKLMVMVVILVLLTVLLTLFRAFSQKAFRAIFNENLLNQLFREIEGRGIFPYLVLYAMFFINMSTLLFFAGIFFFPAELNGDFQTLASITAAVLVIFLLKHFLLAVVGFIFPVQTEIRRYNYSIIIFSALLGILLAPVNLLVAYAPASATKSILFFSLGLIFLTYSLRTIRGLFIANNFLVFHKFHFLLYICTVEIAPALVISKLIINQLA